MKIATLTKNQLLTVRCPVTAEHLKNGQRQKCHTCPVALAVKAIFPGMLVNVTNRYITVLNAKGSWVLYAITPPEIAEYVDLIDEGEPVDPYRFEIEFHAFLDTEVTYDEAA